MKKMIIIQISLIVLLSNYSCNKRCKDYQHVELANITKEYFGNYKPGAYWIYLNRDSTKRDSVWLDNFNKYVHEPRIEPCISTDEITFDLHSKYVHSEVLNTNIGANTNADPYRNLFIMTYLSQMGFVALSMTDNSDSFYNSFGTFPVLYNYPLWNNEPNQILPKVSKVNDLVFAPNLGIVQYVSHFGNSINDTFSLIKIHIP